jgi:hypothetical protein
MKLPFVVLACNSDLPRQVEPENVLDVLQQYDVGLVEVAKAQDKGKEKSRRAFEWLIKAVFRHRSSFIGDNQFCHLRFLTSNFRIEQKSVRYELSKSGIT